jgi:Uma2 family endonuclease
MPQPLAPAEGLLHATIRKPRTELVRGRLIVHEPPGYQHGRVSMRLYDALSTHVERTAAGMAFASEIGFRLGSNPDTVRAPDVGFISGQRLPDPMTPGYPALTPDLVVEVLSPSDRAGKTLAKVGDWLEAGAQLALGHRPRARRADLSCGWKRSRSSPRMVTSVRNCPAGLRCPVAAIF